VDAALRAEALELLDGLQTLEREEGDSLASARVALGRGRSPRTPAWRKTE